MYIHVIHVITYTCIFCRTATNQVQKWVAEPSQYFWLASWLSSLNWMKGTLERNPLFLWEQYVFLQCFLLNPFDLSIESHCNIPYCFYHFWRLLFVDRAHVTWFLVSLSIYFYHFWCHLWFFVGYIDILCRFKSHPHPHIPTSQTISVEGVIFLNAIWLSIDIDNNSAAVLVDASPIFIATRLPMIGGASC